MQEDKFKQVANQIRDLETRQKQAADAIISADKELHLFNTIKNEPKNMTVAGVDGGLHLRRFHGADLILTRAAAAIFSIENQKLKKTRYSPELIPQPKPYCLTNALDSEESMISASIHRLREEITTAICVAEKENVELLLLDGSIFPQNADKPRAGSKLNTEYNSLLSLYEKLYKTCEKTNTTLAGIVEDSRGTIFCTTLVEDHAKKLEEKNKATALKLTGNKKTIETSTDTTLLFFAMKKKQYTTPQPYSKDPRKHPVLKDFPKEIPEKIKVSYLKNSEFDRPLRIEFMLNDSKGTGKGKEECIGGNDNNKSGRIKSEQNLMEKIFFLSSSFRTYAYPTVLIEADLRAKLKYEEVEFALNSVIDQARSTSILLELRRDSRPF
ncbi:MAG: DNA double-strand break repair nuclease NurA [Candidatus Diapherotrites archaeon]|nr:DNA double-strand break repair nuclease NurA [Candidatus Diapherotrites archaeon]